MQQAFFINRQGEYHELDIVIISSFGGIFGIKMFQNPCSIPY